MQQRLLSVFNSLRDKWNEWDRSRKIKIILSVAAVIVALGAVIYIATKPKMVVVLQNLTYAEGVDARSVLSSAGINSVVENGELKVREADVDLATYEITNSDRTTINGPDKTFAEAMDLITMGTTESTKRDIMINQKERYLENSLKMFNGVASAVVNLNIPEDERSFIKSEQKATAGVILTTSRDITSKEAQAMARFICKSVKGLAIEDVEIVNQNMETLYSGTKMSSDGYAESYELEMIKKAEIERAVKQHVYPMYDEVSVLTKLDIDNDKLAQEVLRYTDPNADEGQSGFTDNILESSSSVTGSVAEGEPGVGSNNNAAGTYETGNDTTSSAKTKESQISYLYNKIIESTEKATGVINYDNCSLSIRVIKKHKYFEEDLEKSGQLTNTTWQQYKADNEGFTTIDVDANLLENIKIGTGISNVSIIAFEEAVFIDKPVTVTAFQNYIILAILALLILLLLYGFIKKTQQDEVTEVEPELSVEDLLVSTQLEEEKEAEAERLKEIAFNQESEAMKQIDTFISERPEAVAQLLRNWLNEEWE